MKTNQPRKRVAIVSLELVKEASTFAPLELVLTLKLSMNYSPRLLKQKIENIWWSLV